MNTNTWAILLAGAVVLLLWLVHTIRQKIPSGTQIRTFQFSPDGQILYGAGSCYEPPEYGSWVWAWDTTTGKQLWKNELEAPVSELSLSPDGTTLLTTGIQGVAYQSDWGGAMVWEAHTGQLRFLLKDELQGRVTENTFLSPDGLRILGCYQEGIQIWETLTGKPLAFWEIPAEKDGWPIYLDFAPDGSTMVVQAEEWSDDDNDGIQHGNTFVQLWNAQTGALIQDFLIDKTTPVIFSADSKRIALIRCSQGSQKIELWSVEGQFLHQSPELPEGFDISQFAFQPDGNVYCAGIYEFRTVQVTSNWNIGGPMRNQAFVWDIPTNQLIEHSGVDEEDYLSPDGMLKAVVNLGGHGYHPPLGAIYRTDTGEKLCDLEGLAGH